MGVAAYNRGTALIRTQTDRDMEHISGERDGRSNREDMLRTRAEAAEHDLERARQLIGRLRAVVTYERSRLADEREAHDTTRGYLAIVRESCRRVRRSWLKASALLRMLPPEKVNELRAERDAIQPE